MTNIDRAAEVLWLPEPHLSTSECDDQARELAQALADAGLLMPAPQIIRNLQELEALDPDTVIQPPLDDLGVWPRTMTPEVMRHFVSKFEGSWFPAVVIVPADQVRAAYKALEEA